MNNSIGKRGFHVPAPGEAQEKPRLPDSAVEEFAGGAKSGHVVSLAVQPVVSDVRNEPKPRHMIVRLTQAQFDRIDRVYDASRFKSKQEMGEALLMESIENLAKNLGI